MSQSLSLPWTQYCLKQIGSHWQSSVTQAGSPGGGRARLVTRARPVTQPGPLGCGTARQQFTGLGKSEKEKDLGD